jgi:hypothetical protein
MNILADIQKKLKAPKKQINKFGNYHYRSCEDILEAVKPLLPEDCFITLSDEIVYVEGRHYVKATATLHGGESIVEFSGVKGVKPFKISVSAFAREALDRKGMDDSQITGSASSYARKFALNGLLMIDDTADADTADNREETAGKMLNEKIEKEKLDGFLSAHTLSCDELCEKMSSSKNIFELKARKNKYIAVFNSLSGEEQVKVKMASDRRKGELEK